MSVPVLQIQSTAKSIFKDLDLYGNDVLIETLKRYPFISWRDKTIPSEGSPTRSTAHIKNEAIKNITQIICHRDGKTTIKTNLGYLQFFAAGMQVKD